MGRAASFPARNNSKNSCAGPRGGAGGWVTHDRFPPGSLLLSPGSMSKVEPQLPKADLLAFLVSPFWDMFSQGPKHESFVFRSFWTSEEQLTEEIRCNTCKNRLVHSTLEV